MAVKWIGDAAADLGLDVLDAVEFLASKGNYPMNGLLDEERVQFLKLGKAGNRMESTNPVAVARPDEKPSKKGRGAKEPETSKMSEGDGATTPITPVPPVPPVATGRDKAEDRTVIIHNPLQQADQG